MSFVAVVLTSLVILLPATGSSLTRGFPSLEELVRNGSLLERYSTHDGELRTVPGVRGNCSGTNGRISKITFVALSGVGVNRPSLRVGKSSSNEKQGGNDDFEISGDIQTFGEYVYEFTMPLSTNIAIDDLPDTPLLIMHPPYEDSGLRLLHQVGDVIRDVWWATVPGTVNYKPDYDYPLLAIETDPPGCMDGLVSASELRRLWENRAPPILYSGPEREISLNCSPSASISRILVGTYSSMSGNETPQIRIDRVGNNDQTCSVSTEPVTEGISVYECVLGSPWPVDDAVTLNISQRNAARWIAFLHDNETDIPLVSVDISGDCSSSQLLSEADLRGMTALYIPNITEKENNVIQFQQLKFPHDGTLVNWTFVARDIGEGEEYPKLSICRENKAIQWPVENINCTATFHPNVYECSVTPKSVEAGDFIGLVLPPLSTAHLLLRFLITNESHSGESFITGKEVEGLPLVSVGIIPIQSSTPSPSSTGGDDYIIIGVVCSLSVVILTVSVLSIALVLWMRRKRRRLEGVAYCPFTRESKEISLSKNEAYISTDESRSDKLAFDLANVSGTSGMYYDYARV